ncbi:MAG: DUF3795 domain-containing protein [Candidatus Delongbacteria bacterium]|nr:DUF3795 domain-containing protein [Candidatus Delongbacteria bacterium]
MSEMIAYCGLDCLTCPIYLATRVDDKQEQLRLRMDIATMSAEEFGMEVTPDEVTDCDGCRSDTGRLFAPCRRCTIRACAGEKKLDNCAYCTEYECDKLTAFFKYASCAKSRLDSIHFTINGV